MRGWIVLVAVLGVVPLPQSQTPQSAGSTFEVASVKPTNQPPSGAPPFPDRFVNRSTTLMGLLVYAYEVEGFQVQGGPDWVRSTRFAVEAKAASRQTPEQMRRLVRQLLAERFSLKTHVETRELPRYALVTARDDGRLGEKLRPSSINCPALIKARRLDDTPPPVDPTALGRLRQPGAPPRCEVTARMTGDSVTVAHDGTPLSEFARSLWSRAGRIVIDKTGLTGTYDIELETERQAPTGLPVQPGPTSPREGLSLFTALQEQLGLKLESERGPVDILVIDNAEAPTPD